jgi:CPA2 family monovalent cation:H+ antiporter-2
LLAPLAKLLRVHGIEDVDATSDGLRDHVIVIGYGVAGRLVATSLRSVGIRQVILELNAENVRRGRENGDPVFYADATSSEALAHAQLTRARCVVIMINDPQATHRVIDAIRRQAPTAPIVVRMHYMAEQGRLVSLGANRVVVEEVEGGLEVLAQVMRQLDIPRNVIQAEIQSAREATKATDRRATLPRNRWSETSALSALKVESVLVVDGSRGASRSLRELALRASTGASVVAIQRGETLQSHPDADASLMPGDVVYLIGESNAVQAAARMLGEPAEAAQGVLLQAPDVGAARRL